MTIALIYLLINTVTSVVSIEKKGSLKEIIRYQSSVPGYLENKTNV